MAKLGLINPVLPGEISQAGMLVCVSRNVGAYYSMSAKPDTSAIESGFRQVGVLAELPQVEVGIETEPVTTGIYGLPAELLFKGVSGKISFNLYGLDPGVLSLGLGVDPIVTTEAGTTTSGAITADATTGNSVLAVTSAAGITAGDTLQVCATGETAYSANFGRVVSVASSNVTLDRVLREKPASGASVKKVTSVMLPIGGMTPKYFSLACLVDFPDGRVGMVAFPKVYSAKPLSFGLGSGQDPVKVPIELQAVGTLDATYGVLLGKIALWPV
jgi:hypothetical protein